MEYGIALTTRGANEPIALLTESLPGNRLVQGLITTNEFLGHVQHLAGRLPKGQFAINVCDNRYLFLVTLCAVALRQQTNLLPSNKNPATQAQLSERYSDSYVIHDAINTLADLPSFDVSQCDFIESSNCQNVPEIASDHIAAISFTSGSTGEAKPNIKSWHTLQRSTQINSHHMLIEPTETTYHLATVSAQHMWGLETSVLMALFAKVVLVDARPLYPYDIASKLNQLPQPRTLISTPLHLRALYLSDVRLPKLNSVLTATAPLTKELAKSIEKKFNTELREVYGCSEAGSMAIRHTAHDELWRRFEQLEFEPNTLGETLVNASHLPGAVTLEDNITMVGRDHFRLNGRSGDQIKIAGKRGSLDEVNKALLSFGPLIDGVVFFPAQKRTVPRLVAIVVLEDPTQKTALRAHFLKALDPAFVPRPILVVEALPREDNGKLIKSKLLDFHNSLIKR